MLDQARGCRRKQLNKIPDWKESICYLNSVHEPANLKRPATMLHYQHKSNSGSIVRQIVKRNTFSKQDKIATKEPGL